MATVPDPAGVQLPCPHCQRSSDSLKSFTAATALFFVVGASIHRYRMVACPECMRKKVLQSSALNLLTANIIWPIAILPATLILLYRSTRPGHSKEVLELVGIGVPAGGADASATPKERGPLASRLFGVVKILMGVTAALGVSFFLFEFWHDWGHAIWAWAALAAAGVGVACAVVFSGFQNLRLARAERKALGLMGLAAAFAFLLALPVIASAYWRSKADGILQEGDLYRYLVRVPPELWTVDGATKIVDWKSDVLTKHADDADANALDAKWDYRDLAEILADLERHHGASAEFGPLLERLRALLKEYKRLGEETVTGVPAEAPGGQAIGSPVVEGEAHP